MKLCEYAKPRFSPQSGIESELRIRPSQSKEQKMEFLPGDMLGLSMVILDRYKKADVPAQALEDFIAEYQLVMAVEEALTTAGQDGLLIEFLKLQQDCGVQDDVARTLAGTNISLDGSEQPELRYGIDEGAVAPGEHTERTYTAYEAVTLARLNQILPRIHAQLSDPALAREFKTALEQMGLVSFPARPASPAASPSSPASSAFTAPTPTGLG
jgi:hypothetical protein